MTGNFSLKGSHVETAREQFRRDGIGLIPNALTPVVVRQLRQQLQDQTGWDYHFQYKNEALGLDEATYKALSHQEQAELSKKLSAAKYSGRAPPLYVLPPESNGSHQARPWAAACVASPPPR